MPIIIHRVAKLDGDIKKTRFENPPGLDLNYKYFRLNFLWDPYCAVVCTLQGEKYEIIVVNTG